MNLISKQLELGMQLDGSAVALFDDEITVTYHELQKKTRRIAGLLQQKGVHAGDMVAIVMPRSMRYVIAETACLLYGFGAVLLDSGYPEDRISFCVEDSGAKQILDEDFYREAMSFSGAVKTENITAETPAIAVYTSGSTGRPKGVLHDQRSIGQFMERFFALTEPEPSDVVGAVCPFTFSASLNEACKALCAGSSVIVISRDVLMNPIEMAEFIDRHRITHVYMPPKVLKLFKKKGDTLKQIHTASEPVRGIAPDGYRVFNLFGMSEANVLLAFEIDRAYDNTPIGKSLDGVSAYVLNGNNEICEEGELCVSGCFMSRYIGLPEKTDETKVKNPFFAEDGHEYMLRTGDIVRRLPDGNLLYVNRKDWMVKINGQRVEPGEVEFAIRQVEGVKDAAVKGFEEEHRTYLCAFYVAEKDVEEADILSAISKNLAAYMIPERFVRMDALPLNANGKLDRIALEPPAVQTKCEAPQNADEETALRLAKEILQDTAFGVTDDLDLLGMDSVRAMDFSVKLQEAGLDISTSTIMKCRTIRDMLSEEKSMMWFVEEYDDKKPVLVISSGIVVLRPVLPFYQKLSRHYNILLIEPVQDHLKTLEGMKYDEIILLYMDKIKKIVPDPDHIIGFMGFSFGGELSASLARRFEELYGKRTFVIMGDTVIKLRSQYLDREIVKEDLSETVIIGLKERLDSMLYRMNIINRFGYGEHYACYDGPVTLIDAGIGYTEEEEEAKLTNAKGRFPDLTIVPMKQYTHSDLFRILDLVPFYERLIEKCRKEDGF